MSLTVSAAANRIFQEFRTDFFQEFDRGLTLWRTFGMEIPVNSRSTLFAWIANQNAVREWIGPRQAKDMSTRTWEVFTRKFELTYGFTRDQIDDDLSGLMAQALMEARNQGKKWLRHEDLLMTSARTNGTTNDCWDGQPFYNGSHPIDPDGYTSGTFSNLITATPLTHAGAQTALARFRQFKNADGSPMFPFLDGLVCVVPTGLELQARQVFETKELTTAASYGLAGTGGMSENPLYGRAKVQVNPYLDTTSQTTWYMDVTSEPMKPYALLRRRPLEMKEEGPTSSLFFEEERIRIGSDARYDATFTLPQLSICVQAS